MTKTAVILFNLGGPDSPEAVQPFLFNLFNDPAIIGAPTPIRWFLAKFISKKRAPVARDIYARIGGKSPLLGLTLAQAEMLGKELGPNHRVFVCMRYWHPMTKEIVEQVRAWGPDRVILLPLYPQYSSTTSGSSIKAWQDAAKSAGLTAPTQVICCYPTEKGLISAMARLTAAGLAEARLTGKPRLLFSAHGLPKKIVEAGDPYQYQVEQTAQALVKKLQSDNPALADLDWSVCYQSRVGPLEWIGPSTEAELERAAADKVPVVIVPIAFVSEHSETLVELDIEYRERAHELGIPAYVRVPALGTAGDFIQGLAGLVRAAQPGSCNPCSQSGGRLCPGGASRCPNAGKAERAGGTVE